MSLERDEPPPQDIRYVCLTLLVQRLEDAVKVCKVGLHRIVDCRAPGVGQRDHHATAVVFSLLACDEAASFESIDACGHCAAGDHQTLTELSRREPEWGPGASERSKDVDLPPLQVERREQLVDRAVQVVGEPSDTGNDVERRDVELRTLLSPLREEPVDSVLGRRHAREYRRAPKEGGYQRRAGDDEGRA